MLTHLSIKTGVCVPSPWTLLSPSASGVGWRWCCLPLDARSKKATWLPPGTGFLSDCLPLEPLHHYGKKPMHYGKATRVHSVQQPQLSTQPAPVPKNMGKQASGDFCPWSSSFELKAGHLHCILTDSKILWEIINNYYCLKPLCFGNLLCCNR